MKKLTKIKLINWHYFANETINIKNDCLITGQNATGKSTILDALQYVLTAGDQNFNMAAHDHGNRNLRGYICCKLGRENQEYLRTGDVTTIVALEFYDDVDQNHFCVGVVMDYKQDIDSVKSIFFSTMRPLDEDMFIEDNMVLSIPNFKKTGLIDSIYGTKRETKIAFRALFGPINERFFTLIPKALAFKAIINVKDFIYQYLLEEKKIEVENIQDSIRMYKDLERTLKVIKRKIQALSQIQELASKIKFNHDKTSLYDLLIKLTSIDEQKAKTIKLKNDLEKFISQKDDQLNLIKNIENEKSIYDEKSKLLYNNLSSNDSFRNKEQIQSQISRIRNEYNVTVGKRDNLFNTINNNMVLIDNYLRKNEGKLFRPLRSIDFKSINSTNFNEIKSKLIDINSSLEERLTSIIQLQGQLTLQKKEKAKEYEQVVNTIKHLEGRKIKYPTNVSILKDSINEKLEKNANTDVRVTILAELIEVTDPEWSDAIENYLNAQRFTLIIDPQYYDYAIDVFDEIKSKKTIYGVGLVNTKMLNGYDTPEENSLAELITSTNTYAKRYINMILGHVKRAKGTHDLENYRTAITKESVVYNNYTVRQLNTNIEKPFIGRNIFEKQLPKHQKDERRIHQEYIEIEKTFNVYDEEIKLINKIGLSKIIESLNVILACETQEKTLYDFESQKSKLESSNLSDIQKEYEKVSQKQAELNKKVLDQYQTLGSIKEKIVTIEGNIANIEQNVIISQEAFDKVRIENISLESEVFEMYREDSKKFKPHDLLEKYKGDLEDIYRAVELIEDELKDSQLKYNNEYTFMGILGYENMHYYTKEYDKLVGSNLVEYEDKVRAAREDTERLFKEDFISKLRSNIFEAQDGVKKINEALTQIKFGEDKYEFVFLKSAEFSGIYDMVMNEDEGKGPIVTYEFESKYKAELSMLFDSLTIDEINSEGVISKFTDYRTYMDYDIKITNSNGDIAMFSKIFKEKSGGETQVPFYVSVIASFVQLYSGVKSSIGLILFDEAFDKMDSNRIAMMMQFVKELDLQLIIAATPQKLDPITNYVDTTMIIIRRDNNSYVVPKTKI